MTKLEHDEVAMKFVTMKDANGQQGFHRALVEAAMSDHDVENSMSLEVLLFWFATTLDELMSIANVEKALQKED